MTASSIHRSRKPPSPQSPSFLEMDYAILSQRARRLFQSGLLLLTLASGLAGATLLATRPEWSPAFFMMLLPTLLGLWLWTKSPRTGLPFLPLFLIQQAFVYALPLVVGNETLIDVGSSVITTAGLGVGIFLICLLGGWRLAVFSGTSKPSKANIVLPGRGAAVERCLTLAFALLGLSLAFELAVRAGVIFKVLPTPLHGMLPIIRIAAGAAGILGAFFGGLAVGDYPEYARRWIYWALLLSIFFLSVGDVLISAASALVISAVLGLALGKQRVPFGFLLVALGLVGFLNQGKFDMRARYWSGEGNFSGISLRGLPAFYGEWAAASAGRLFGSETPGGTVVTADGDNGQSIFDRVNNMQNMVFVLRALESPENLLLMGQTYSLIPALFIPRFLWAEKPRTHEGQILLNLHFGRQMNVEQTERTFIAWGLLPEAVGNFGSWFGPPLLGLFLGVVMGWLERISRAKRLFSVEGMVLGGLLLITVGSYEMVASVLLTSIFQFLVVVTIGGFILRAWFGRGAAASLPVHRPRRIVGITQPHASGAPHEGNPIQP
jgi:hypothetical protein